jgi:NAD(P)H-hydrate epimerase
MINQRSDPRFNLFSAKQVRELDRITIGQGHVTGMDLMERAGKAVWEKIIQAFPDIRSVLVVCGAGNNAGDGYVIARLAHESSKRVKLVALTDPEKLHGDALKAAEKYLAVGKVTDNLDAISDANTDVIVDAILGTGLDREVSGIFSQAIEFINQCNAPVFAVDIPSGLNANNGKVMGSAVHASRTITFIGRKLGLYLGEAPEYRGKLDFNDLGVPDEVYEGINTSCELMHPGYLSQFLPKRGRLAHKGDFGHVLVVGGDHGYAGAPRMCAEAAARAGAGLVSIATRKEHAVTIPAIRPELMATAVEEEQDLTPLLERASVVALGPGLAQTRWSMAMFSRILDTHLPIVVDADALNLLALEPHHRDNWILTPHPGEAARLLDQDVTAIQNDRLATVHALQARYGGTVVLKGAGSLIAYQHSRVIVSAEGNPGMASGGMGDVLTGIIAGLRAQKLEDTIAAALGVYIHAHAADLCAKDGGERGMLATDLMPYIRQLLNP